jgi:hypothetical protein
MDPLLQPLADALGIAPSTAALLVGLVLGAGLLWALRGRRDAQQGGPPRPSGPPSLPFPTRPTAQVPDGPLDEHGRRDVEALLDEGKAIDAIKRVRELTGLGLKEAKDYVDALRRARG